MKSIKMLLIILPLILNVIVVKAGNSSLSFVIDDSDSMGEEIDQVRRGARGIMDIILNYKSSQVKDIVLVTFNDPESLNKLRIITNDPEKLQQQLDIIQPYNENNNDYEEYSLSGIKLALEHSRPNSYVFVFTDASAKDLYEATAIKTTCQRTQTQINFILTDYCIEKKDRKCLIYHEIALACSGQVFRVYKDEINKVIEYIKETIQGEKNILTTRTLPAYENIEVEFEVNDDIEYVLISGAGRDISISASKGPSNHYTSVLSTYNTKVIKLNNPTPGTYGVVVYGTDAVQLQIFGRTDFTFEHGFSQHIPKTILNTSKQPLPGKNYLTISITNDHNIDNIENAMIWDMADTSLYILTLKKVGDLYVTEPFEVPEELFKISVTGSQNGKRIHRFAKTPIEPQSTDTLDDAEDKAPVTSIVEGANLNVHYNATLQLTCIVFAYPEPTITWRDHGELIQSQSFILEQPYQYISYILIDHVTNSTLYTCDAINDVSRNSSNVKVNVDSPFTIPISPEDHINFPYGLIKAGIKCNITSEYRMRIDWFRRVNGNNIQLHESDKYMISSNGSELNFKTVSLASAGEYMCKAVLVDDPRQYKELTTNVTVHIRDEAPVTSINQGSEVNVPYNGTLNLTCAVFAYPTPNITWLNGNKIFMGLNNMSLPVDHPYNSTSSILIENIKNATTFTCEAYNNVSTDRSIISIKVDSPFTALTYPAENSTLTYNTEAVIECNVKSSSRMRIDWFRNIDGSNIQLHTSDKYTISSDGTELRFTNVTLASAGEYTCKAVLIDDPSQYKEFTTNVTVHIRDEAPVTSIIQGSEVHVPYNGTLNLTCAVYAYPPPNITWLNGNKIFMGLNNTSRPVDHPYNSTSSILIENIKNATTFTCEAYNNVSSNRTVISIKVDSPFTALIYPGEYSTLTYNTEAAIECNVKSSSRMRIEWFRRVDGSNIQLHPSDKYMISPDGTELRFTNATLTSAGEYTCKAVLVDDPSQYKEFTTNVTVHIRDEAPVTSIIQGSEVHVPYNGTLNLTCAVFAYPPPNITWLNGNKIFMGLYNTSRPVDHPYNSISSIKIENIRNATTYTCEAYNNVSSNRTVISIKVDSPFTALKYPAEYSKLTYNTEAVIECNVKSSSRMRIDWFRRVDGSNIQLHPSDKYTISSDGTELRFSNATLTSAGEYICKAVVVDDPSQYKEFTTNVTVHIRDEAPVTSFIQGSEVHVPYNGTLNLTCAVYAYPPPNITWWNGNKTFMGLNNTSHPVDYPYNFTSSILIENIKNATTFTCEAYNNVSTDRSIISIIVDSPFTALIYPAEYSTLTYNTEAAIECNVKSSSRMRIDWFRRVDGSNIQLHTSDKYTISSDGTELRFTNATLASAGEYTCKAVLIDDPSQYEEFTTDVDIVIEHQAPITNIPVGSHVQVPYNGTLLLACNAYGFPTPNITWSDGYKQLSSKRIPGATPYDHISNLKINGITTGGIYECSAKNNISTSKSRINVTVLLPPNVQEALSAPVKNTTTAPRDCNKDNNTVQIPTVVSTYPGPYIGGSISNGIIISALPLMEQPQDLKKYMIYSNTITSVTTYVTNQQIVTSAQANPASDIKENYSSTHNTPNNVIVETVPAVQAAAGAEDTTRNVQYYDPFNIQKNLAMTKSNTIFNIAIPQGGPRQPPL